MQQTILVLGGGTGGLIAARELNRILRIHRKTNPYKILVFEKEEKNVFAPSLLWLMVGKRKPEQVYSSTTKIARDGIEVVLGKIERIDPEKKSIIVEGKEYTGDYLIISLGVEQLEEHNLNEYGHDFFTMEGAANYYDQLKKFKGGKIAIVIPSLPFKCPAAPYEAALLVKNYINENGLDDATEVSLYTPEPFPMGVAGKEISSSVQEMLAQKGINYYPEFSLTEANEKSLTFHNGAKVEYDLLAFTPKHQCPSIIKNTGLAGSSGWIEVDRHSMKTGFPDIYAIGDVTFIPLEMGKPLPKAGVFAHYQAKVVAHNIAQQIEGKLPEKTFNGYGQCFLEVGGGKSGYASGNFYGSPKPDVRMKKPNFFWHWTKVWFEKYWFIKYL